MYGNNRFRAASKAETPQFASAAARQGQAENQAKMQENSQLSNNLMGAGKLYNDGMGDKTPLYDLLEDAFGGGEQASLSPELVSVLRSGADVAADAPIDPAALANMQQEAALAAANQGEMAPDFYSSVYPSV